MTNIERKSAGLPYRYDDPAIMGDQLAYQELLYEYNQTRPLEHDRKQELLRRMFGRIGDGCHIETPLNANWGCHHVYIGSGVYCNANVTFVDDERIDIGDYCLIAPNVVISTSGHPLLPILREHHYVYNLPVRIGRNVWLGSGAQVMPGVTIGDDSVIGAGSVVTRDIPANALAFGAPCRVIREIGEYDRQFFRKNSRLDVWE
ncbi:MAG: sugar O-acetyltransferase [Oscillospiraceae bacterium]|jgi:galactoside O-acetyltransferase|nr:sugar O-acetyltransferase [Oscillospiraceae bacterium]